MYRIVEGDSRGRADVEEFIGLINEPPADLRDFFDPTGDIIAARAPGRLDVMGGIADYSGSLVLEMPIAEATFAAVQKCDEESITVVSLAANKVFRSEMSLSDLAAFNYESARAYFQRDLASHWASYVLGVFIVLTHETGFDFFEGSRILISSQIPIGRGVSSSAALEVATMQAVCKAFEIVIDPVKMALLCQRVENAIVGAPCGVMDQITSHCGQENSLTPLLCQPAEIQDSIAIPDTIEFWGIDSGVRHAVTGADYSSVRIAAFMGSRIIAEMAGMPASGIESKRVAIDDDRWNGYLCNVTPPEYENEFSAYMPAEIGGGEFLEKYQGTTDQVTTVDPAMNYAVRAATEHAIYENHRVGLFARLLSRFEADDPLDSLGDLMYDSHASYSRCGLTETGTNRIVTLTRQYRDKGIFGARITGGGSGGTVAILARRGGAAAISDIAEIYGRETHQTPYIFHESSPGCAIFGSLRVRWQGG